MVASSALSWRRPLVFLSAVRRNRKISSISISGAFKRALDKCLKLLTICCLKPIQTETHALPILTPLRCRAVKRSSRRIDSPAAYGIVCNGHVFTFRFAPVSPAFGEAIRGRVRNGTSDSVRAVSGQSLLGSTNFRGRFQPFAEGALTTGRFLREKPRSMDPPG